MEAFASKAVPQSVEIKGKRYPLRIVMGAFYKYKQLTGHDYDPTESGGLSDQLDYLYCAIKAACQCDGVEFPYKDSDALACDLDSSKMTEINSILAAQARSEAADGDEKKSE